jgi:hypothetical protein
MKALLLAALAVQAETPPETRALVKRVMDGLFSENRKKEDWAFTRRSETKELDAEGKTKSQHSTTTRRELIEGVIVNRLIERDGKPIPDAERKQIESLGTAKKSELNSDLAQRETIAAQIPEELLAIYARVAKRHHGVALAEAATEQCRGCGMRLLPHTFQEIRQPENREIFQCETCNRILYAVEPVPAKAPDLKEGAASSAS